MHFEKDDIPPGFGMLLGRNENAMKCFSGMTDTEKEDVIRQAQAARSTDDIAQIIECTLVGVIKNINKVLTDLYSWYIVNCFILYKKMLLEMGRLNRP